MIFSNFRPDIIISRTNDVQFTHNKNEIVQFFGVCRPCSHHQVARFCIEGDKKIKEMDIRVSYLRTTPPNVAYPVGWCWSMHYKLPTRFEINSLVLRSSFKLNIELSFSFKINRSCVG